MMTHKELLARIQSDYELNKHFRDEPKWKPFAALRAVVELHKPTNFGSRWLPEDKYCSICVEADSYDAYSLEYPCPTIQAIEKELG